MSTSFLDAMQEAGPNRYSWVEEELGIEIAENDTVFDHAGVSPCHRRLLGINGRELSIKDSRNRSQRKREPSNLGRVEPPEGVQRTVNNADRWWCGHCGTGPFIDKASIEDHHERQVHMGSPDPQPFEPATTRHESILSRLRGEDE